MNFLLVQVTVKVALARVMPVRVNINTYSETDICTRTPTWVNVTAALPTREHFTTQLVSSNGSLSKVVSKRFTSEKRIRVHDLTSPTPTQVRDFLEYIQPNFSLLQEV